MHIAGLQKCSMVDYPGEISIVIFTPGCNYDCFYCHNRELMEKPSLLKDEDVIAFLRKRIILINSLVITGGEATLQKDLKDFIIKAGKIGYKIKLDTNGSNPDVLSELIDENLLSYIAIDLKAPFGKYEEICGKNIDTDKVKESINIAKNSGVLLDIRTTFIPQFSVEEIASAVKEIAPIKHFSIQQYKKPQYSRERDRFRTNKAPHSSETLERLKKACEAYCDEIIIRE